VEVLDEPPDSREKGYCGPEGVLEGISLEEVGVRC
jgi:hypothetical protein